MNSEMFFSRVTGFESITVPNKLFIQFYNLINDHSPALNSKVDGYEYSRDYSDELSRIVLQSQKKLCNERGYISLDKPDYNDSRFVADCHRIFKAFACDNNADPLDKLTLFELIFREIEYLLVNEISFLEEKIPVYREEAERIKLLSEETSVNYFNSGEENLKKAQIYLREKGDLLQLLRSQIKDRLKRCDIPLTYYNGYFHKHSDILIEKEVISPFWEIISNKKYKNIATDMRTALDLFQKRGRDSVLYAAKALESMIKIICKEKNIARDTDKTASARVTNLYKNNILLKAEQDELIAMFQIRNPHGHGSGDEEMPQLTMEQELRFIHSCMIWIYSLRQR